MNPENYWKYTSRPEDLLIPSPIHKVLSSIAKYQVRALLMGGQACILYGASELTRDIDFAILASPGNLSQLASALALLEARVIAVPPFELEYLNRGHAVHFRCSVPEAAGWRVDIMTRMRGVDSFSDLWHRRTTVTAADGTRCDLMSLPDLIQAKKTQRDKDWPMIRRLVEADYFAGLASATDANIRLWLAQLRTPELLIEVAAANPQLCRSLEPSRPLLRFAAEGDEAAVSKSLAEEEIAEREADRMYWKPLKAELEQLRHQHLRDQK